MDIINVIFCLRFVFYIFKIFSVKYSILFLYLSFFKFLLFIFVFLQTLKKFFFVQVSDWMVDYHTPGGVDKDGWQVSFSNFLKKNICRKTL